MYSDVIAFIKDLYGNKEFTGLHEPVFAGKEREYVINAIDSTFVSSVGAYVNKFEADFASYVGASGAVVTGNGTAALHTALHLLNVDTDDEVITQALTFIATANAISYCKAHPIFVDSDFTNFGMCPQSLEQFLITNAEVRNDGFCYNKKTQRKIKACVPMHVFGHPVKIEEIVKVCERFQIPVIEDAAESLGSLYKGKHTGLFGKIGIFSFNGNKIITTGGGGMIVSGDEKILAHAKHITTTAKIPHPWSFRHDELGFNYRMPNLNAALGLGQLERLEEFVANKRQTASIYQEYFNSKGIEFVVEPEGARSNYWLNAILLKDKSERDRFLEESNSKKVMARPVWDLMPDLPMFAHCQKTDLSVARSLWSRIVNIPSSVRSL